MHKNNFIAVKSTAVNLAPSGRPRFDLMFNSTTQVSILGLAMGAENVVKLIYLLIVDINEFFNVKNRMNENQITDLSFDIFTELKNYRFEEIVVLFECIKKQTYGKIYERLDASIIWEHFKKYDEERNLFFENEHTTNKFVDNQQTETIREKTAKRINEYSGAFSVLKDYAKDNRDKMNNQKPK